MNCISTHPSGKKAVIYLAFAIIVCLSACTPSRNANRIAAEDVKMIVMGSAGRGIETIADIETVWGIIVMDTFRDTLITDSVSINYFTELVNALKPSKKANCDIRTIALIIMKDGSRHELGCGYYWGTSLDGQLMKDSKALFSFLNETVYDNHPSDFWFPEWVRSIDTSAVSP